MTTSRILISQQGMAHRNVPGFRIQIGTNLIAICQDTTCQRNCPIPLAVGLQTPHRSVIVDVTINGTTFKLGLRQIDGRC